MGGGRGVIIATPTFSALIFFIVIKSNPPTINNTCGVRIDIKCLSSLKIPQVMNKKAHLVCVVFMEVVYALKVYTAYVHTYIQLHI